MIISNNLFNSNNYSTLHDKFCETDQVADTTKRFKKFGDNESIEALRDLFTRTSEVKPNERVVLGKWKPEGGYIEEAKNNGGIWYETEEKFFSILSADLPKKVVEEKLWQVNEAFIEGHVDETDRFCIYNETRDAVYRVRGNSFTARELAYLDHLDSYEYDNLSACFIKVKV